MVICQKAITRRSCTGRQMEGKHWLVHFIPAGISLLCLFHLENWTFSQNFNLSSTNFWNLCLWGSGFQGIAQAKQIKTAETGLPTKNHTYKLCQLAGWTSFLGTQVHITKHKLDCFVKSKCTLVFVGANLCLILGSDHSEVMNFHINNNAFKR